MLGKLLDWYIARKVAEQRRTLPAIDWQALHESIKDDVEGFSVYLEMRDDRFLPISDPSADAAARADVVGLVVAQLIDGVPPWETEEPAQALAERLSTRPHLTAIVQLSRRAEAFVGYYVRVRPLLH